MAGAVVSKAFFNNQWSENQGGILSHRLVNVFMDELRTLLNKSNISCHINNVDFNHQQYTDDSIMLAPSPTALQRLLYICEDFGKNNYMIFNVTKTVCTCVKSNRFKTTNIPEVFLGGQPLKWISSHKYLGCLY